MIGYYIIFRQMKFEEIDEIKNAVLCCLTFKSFYKMDYSKNLLTRLF